MQPLSSHSGHGWRREEAGPSGLQAVADEELVSVQVAPTLWHFYRITFLAVYMSVVHAP